MTLRALCVAAAAVWVACVWPNRAEACSCMPPGLACEAAWQADAVFVGHVVSIESSTQGRLVQFAVVEGFRGLQLSQATVVTEYGEAACGYAFRMGESYVVYAYRSRTGQLSTSICTRTQPVTSAAADLVYLRSLTAIRPGDRARVVGRVQLSEWSGPRYGALSTMPGVLVTATGSGRTFSTRSDERGAFELTGMPLGTYEVVPRPPEGYDGVRRSLAVHDPRGCGSLDLYVRYDGRVTGRVVDGRGRGLGGVPLDLASTTAGHGARETRYRVRGWSAADGTFELRLVEPGQFILGFDLGRDVDGQRPPLRGFHPGVAATADASRIAVAAGQHVRVADFVIADTSRFAGLQGVVLDGAGQPVGNARIDVHDTSARGEGRDTLPPFMTGADGRFAFTLVDGRPYEVQVMRVLGSDLAPSDVQVARVRVTASEAHPALTIVMKPNQD